MAFQFYIDGLLVDSPVDDQAPSTSINRDRQANGIVVTQDGELVWNANNSLDSGVTSGYTLLRNAFDGGICNEMTFEIRDQVDSTTTEQLYVGVIKVPSIVINHQRQLATIRIQDNNFFSYINNNKNIEYNVQSIKTKNRVDITPPTAYDVDFFESTTGIYAGAFGVFFRGYRVYDVFKFIIAAISDNKIGFESLSLQEEPELFIFDGSSLANPNTSPNVKASFEKLFREVYKLRKIAFYIDATDQENPILRIEDEDSIFSPVQVLTFDEVKEMLSRIKTDNIYGSVKVGASDNPGGAAAVYTFESGISYLGWSEEIYTPLGQCNIDNELNLVNDYGITSNDIHDQVVGAVNSDLDKMFLVECEDVDTTLFTAIAKRYDSWIGTAEYYYNQGTNNPSKLITHGSNYQTGLTNTLEIGSNGFRASRGQDITIASYDPASPVFAGGTGALTTPIVFTDETTGSNYDGNNNYDNVTGIYVAPLDGTYSFNSKLLVDIVNILTCSPGLGSSVGVDITASPSIPTGSYPTTIIRGFIVDLFITVYTDNTLTTAISNQTIQYKIMQDSTDEPLTISDVVNLTTGNAVIVSVLVRSDAFAPTLFGNQGIFNEVNPLPGWSVAVFGCSVSSSARPTIYASSESYYECTGAPDGGGVFVENDPRLFRAKEYEFEYNINQTDWLNIKLNPIGRFAFIKDGITRYGWIESMKRNDWTGQTQIKLISDNAIIP